MGNESNVVKDKSYTGIWNRDFVSIFIANILLNLGLQMANGILTKYADDLGASANEIGLIASLFAVTALVFKVIAGPAIDSLNRKYILAASMTVMSVSFIGYSFSTSVATLSVFSLLRGAAQAFTVTCSLVIATDFLPADKLASGISIYSLAHAVCQALGPALALNLSLFIGYKTTFQSCALIELVGIIWVLLIKKKSVGEKRFAISLDRIVAIEALFPVFILFLLQLANCTITAFLIVYGVDQGIPQGQLGLYFTVYAVVLLVLRPFVGRIADRFGFKWAIMPGMVLFAVSFIVLSKATSMPAILFAAVLAAFGYGASQPIIQALSMKLTPREKHGAASCTCYIGADIGAIIGPNVAGLIVTWQGYPTMWLCMIIPIALGFVLTLSSSKMDRC